LHLKVISINKKWGQSRIFGRAKVSNKSRKLIVQEDFLDDIVTPIFIKNKDGVYTYCNKAFTEFLGMPKTRILGHNAYDIAPKKLADIYVEADKALFDAAANSQEYVANVRPAVESETSVIFRKSIIYDSQSSIDGFIGSVNINTEIIPSGVSELSGLTKRELEVLNLLAKGCSAKAIANLLSISYHTVNDYVKSIYLKLNVHSKGEALYKAISLLAINNPN